MKKKVLKKAQDGDQISKSPQGINKYSREEFAAKKIQKSRWISI